MLLYLLIAYLLFGFNGLILALIVYFYYKFCKEFVLQTYYPLFIETSVLTKEFNEKRFNEAITPSESDSKYHFFLKENTRHTWNRLYFTYIYDREEYSRIIYGSSSFAWIFFPLFIVKYSAFKKLNKHLKQRLKDTKT